MQRIGFLIIPILIAFVVPGACQENPYPFLDLSQNVIHHGTDSSNFNHFLTKLTELKEGRRNRVTFVHIGGSHVQAGFWSEALQDSLQRLAGTSGGGKFLFPYQVAGTNSPPSYQSFSKSAWQVCKATANISCAELGLSGMSLSTTDSSGRIGFTLRSSSGIRQFDSARIFHGDASPFLLSISGLDTGHCSQQVDLDGGYTRIQFPTIRDSLVVLFSRIDTSATSFTLYGATIDDSRPGVFCAIAGVNGATTASFLKCSRLASQVTALQPDLVIFSLGVNDVQNVHFSAENYIANYDSLVTLIRAGSPDCSFLFTTVSDHYRKKKYPNQRTLLANEALKAYCSHKGYALWDLFQVMGGFKSIMAWHRAGLAGRDKVHFTASGYRLLAKLMFQAILPLQKRM